MIRLVLEEERRQVGVPIASVYLGNVWIFDEWIGSFDQRLEMMVNELWKAFSGVIIAGDNVCFLFSRCIPRSLASESRVKIYWN